MSQLDAFSDGRLPTDIDLFGGFTDPILDGGDGLGGLLDQGAGNILGNLTGGGTGVPDIGSFLSGFGLPPLDNNSNAVSTSGTSGDTGLDLIQPVITLSFGGDSKSTGDIAQGIVSNLANQTRQLTAKGTFLGDLGIGADTLLVIGVTVGLFALGFLFR